VISPGLVPVGGENEIESVAVRAITYLKAVTTETWCMIGFGSVVVAFLLLTIWSINSEAGKKRTPKWKLAKDRKNATQKPKQVEGDASEKEREKEKGALPRKNPVKEGH
jgi:hypothetical protein